MKFSISCDQFVSSLGVSARGVSTRSAIQTLSGVLVKAEDGEEPEHARSRKTS